MKRAGLPAAGQQDRIDHVRRRPHVPGQAAGADEDLVAAGTHLTQFEEVRRREPRAFGDDRLGMQAAAEVDVFVFIPRKPAGGIFLEQRPGALELRHGELDVEPRDGQAGHQRHPLRETADVAACGVDEPAVAGDRQM